LLQITRRGINIDFRFDPGDCGDALPPFRFGQESSESRKSEAIGKEKTVSSNGSGEDVARLETFFLTSSEKPASRIDRFSLPAGNGQSGNLAAQN
jgi:hypothetical protein